LGAELFGADGQTDKTVGQRGRQRDRQTYRQDGRTERQAERQTDIQTRRKDRHDKTNSLFRNFAKASKKIRV